jgi:glycosyltransferase involved in cell wall biosynthesis
MRFRRLSIHSSIEANSNGTKIPPIWKKNRSGLRILHVIDHIYPMLGYQETFLAKSHSRDNETMVITSDRFTKSLYYANRKILDKQIIGTGLFLEEGIKILRLPVRFYSELFESPLLIGLEKAVISFRPDIIICHGIVNVSSIRIALLSSKLKNSKLVFDDHMTYNATRGGWVSLLYKLFRIAFTPFFLKVVDVFVATTYETKQIMHDVYGIPYERTKVIPLGIDLDHFYPSSSARDLMRKKYRIGDEDVVFIYAGKIIPAKGVHLLIDAALQICKTNDKILFMVIGGNDPFYLAQLKRKISESKMDDRFIFVDAVPNWELYKYYCAADVGVWPLQCSLTMLEAAACGLPTIISDKSGTTDRVAHGNGLLYIESDTADLARKINLLMDDKLRRTMSENALIYSKTLSWNDISIMFLNVSNC